MIRAGRRGNGGGAAVEHSPPVSRLVALFVGTVPAVRAGSWCVSPCLQVRDQSQYETLGMMQRERTIDLPADRGQILDRDGIPLALTLEARDIYVNPTLRDRRHRGGG